MNPIAQKIREARLKANMSEKDLAKKCGVAPSYIIQIESGKKVVNEQTAERILTVFGEKVGFDFSDKITEEETAAATKVVKKEVAKPQEFYNVEPTDQWAGALANIIKKFPVHDVATNKMLDQKELPVLGKKVEGVSWEKILYVKASDDELSELRIRKGDTLLVHLNKEVQGRGVYLVEIDQKKLLRVVQKETGNTLAVSKTLKPEHKEILQNNQVKILGKCVRVEFNL